MPKAKSVLWALQEEFSEHEDSIYYQVLPNTSAKKTGEFEVFVNSKLVHSKLGGDGLIDTRQKFDKIAKEVEVQLKNLP